jgi:phosphatidylserine decarboxylase
MIRFGSRTEIYLPLEARVSVAIGQHVRGGETVIGQLRAAAKLAAPAIPEEVPA